MLAFERGRAIAAEFSLDEPADLRPVLASLGIEVVPWRFTGRVKEVVLDAEAPGASRPHP